MRFLIPAPRPSQAAIVDRKRAGYDCFQARRSSASTSPVTSFGETSFIRAFSRSDQPSFFEASSPGAASGGTASPKMAPPPFSGRSAANW